MTKISVIIPVYNVEKYLKECLDTILNQTFSDFEVICVNDGSTDNSLIILEEYAKNDKRFKIISQENQGQGVAKNKGIDLAKGDYILFVDPDDWIELNTFEIMYKKFLETDVDVIQFDYNLHYETGKYCDTKAYKKKLKRYFNYSIKNGDIYNWNYISKKQLHNMSLYASDKAYKMDFIKQNNIKFAPNKNGEDHIFSFEANLLANEILYLNKSFYHYRKRNGSAVNKVSDENFCVFENIKLIKSFLITNNFYEEYSNSFNEYVINLLSWHYVNIPIDSVEKYKSRCQEILSIKDYKRFIQKTKIKKSFIEQIFSIKNQKENGIKIKVVTIFGIEFVMKNNKKGGCK